MTDQPNNPLHGVKLAEIVEHLVEKYGWEELSEKININCFKMNPSVKSTLKFLRKTPWAREKVERLYLWSIGKPVPRHRPTRSESAAVKPDHLKDRKKTAANNQANESPWEAARRTREANDE